MKTVLTAAAAIHLVNAIRDILFLEVQTQGPDQLNPDKEWDVETIEYLRATLDEAGIAPEKIEPADPITLFERDFLAIAGIGLRP